MPSTSNTRHLPDDALALSLDGDKSIFAARLGLLKYLASCGLSSRQGALRIREVAEAAIQTLSTHAELAGELAGMASQIKSAAGT